MPDSFDFIVVGGGTAGCLLASRLASSKKRPSILLIEIGGDDSDITSRIPYNRFLNVFTKPNLDHGYVTTPQFALDGKKLPYARGNGLGGCSVINFMLYTRGASADYDRWAELAGDEDWGWQSTKERFKQIESFRGVVPEQLARYAKPNLESYGQDGLLKVTIPAQWESETQIAMDALIELGHPINQDYNTGNPTGVAVGISSTSDGLRTTSSSAYLNRAEQLNLTVWTNTRVTKILLDGEHVVGVETLDGRTVSARLEVVLCTGSIDTPKLLLLSGIGPPQELSELNIEVQHALPGVGKNLQDHCGVFLAEHLGPLFSERVTFSLSPDKMEEAHKQWMTDHTGQLAAHYSSLVIGFIKDPSWFEMEEFKALPLDEQHFLRDPTIPTYELAMNGPLIPPTFIFKSKEDAFLSTGVILMNPQSRGSLRLQSANAEDPPLIDMAYMTHPYDRRSLIESVRRAMQLTKTKTISKYWKAPINIPKSESDKDIWTFIKDNLTPIWHSNGSVMMGKPDKEGACVDSNLRVHGLPNLRVADLSICPTTPNNHTQATAYLIGEFAAEKIIKQYHLG